MATVEQEQANIDKQIAKEIMLAVIAGYNPPATLFAADSKEEYQFEYIWNRIFKAVSGSG